MLARVVIILTRLVPGVTTLLRRELKVVFVGGLALGPMGLVLGLQLATLRLSGGRGC